MQMQHFPTYIHNNSAKLINTLYAASVTLMLGG